jgi:hypothetical protein
VRVGVPGSNLLTLRAATTVATIRKRSLPKVPIARIVRGPRVSW